MGLLYHEVDDLNIPFGVLDTLLTMKLEENIEVSGGDYFLKMNGKSIRIP